MPATVSRPAPLGLARRAPAVAAQPGRPTRAWLRHRPGAPAARILRGRGGLGGIHDARASPLLAGAHSVRPGIGWPGLPAAPQGKASGGGGPWMASADRGSPRATAGARLRGPFQHRGGMTAGASARAGALRAPHGPPESKLKHRRPRRGKRLGEKGVRPRRRRRS